MDGDPFNQQEDSKHAILSLDQTDPFGQTPFAPPVLPNVSTNQPDGFQILNQVQSELQFLPQQNENAYVMGTMSGPDNAGSSKSDNMMNQSMGSPPNADTSYLIGTEETLSPSSTIGPGGPRAKYSLWQFEYYAQYFNLSTDIFFRRIMWSLLPLTGDNKGTYIERHIQSNPDLFGPFWISLTLAFVVTICDDIATYVNQIEPSTGNSSQTIAPPHEHKLAFRFDRLHLSVLITFGYVLLAPLLLWAFCQWRACSKLYSFLECLCAYGYSVWVFIPAAVISLIGIRELQFILFASAAFLSGCVLLISFAPVVHSDASRSFKFAYVMLIFILVSHFILALLYLYVFL
ncbi:hypothetical protein RDWZM_006577 [Blomia tropicalis]|uniref:Protein YIPF n=1 Tax=Blomia tropicalis TaxID=40697 RepID=A0A9Q0RNQ1_BLOTA|nr:hypothetical protein RDWZM_006577 [Blomia tropicalis]